MAGNILQNALIYLGSAVVFVPIAKKLGIGSVLGYILAGIVVGPYVLGFIGHEGEDVMHAAEFGVVMMLFVVGLELSPQSFWKMKNKIIGQGGLQLLLTALLLLPLFYFVFRTSINTAIALSLSFAMSSTAIVLQTLKEKNLEKSAAGQSSFSVLLFQDIAVIPILAILPILAGVQKSQEVISTNPLLAYLQTHSSLTVIAAMLVVFLAGKFLLNPFLYFIAKTRVKELFTASALFIIIGVSIIMTTVGISAALGAFMAGVLLANSEFRHELESNVEPFKGLLLGVFFTAVGSTINFKVLTQQPTMLFTTVAAIMVVKGLVLWLIGKQYKIAKTQNLLFALLLSQAGEFVFVLLGSTQQFGLINKTETDFFMAAVTISMIASPILLFIYEKYIAPRITPVSIEEKEYDVQVDEHNKVIIAGFSHFGSTLGRFLRANNVEATILDNDSDRVNLLRKMGFKVYFGDATRLDLLQAAGAEKAHIVVSTLNDAVANKELAHLIQKHFPHIQLFIRVKNRLEAYEFLEHQIPNVYRETLHTSVYMGVDVLAALGHRRYTATRKANDFIKYDTLSMNKLYKSRNDIDAYISSVREEIEEQEKLLNEDVKFIDKKADNAWDNSALKLA